VSIDGQPLKAGVIRFIPTGTATGPAAVATIKDGAFALKPSDGAVAGTQRVEIEALPEFGFEIDDELAAAQYVQQGGAVSINAIPEIYNQRSTLTREIKPDETNEFDFQLSTTGDAQASR
jgi:hypothetical protein